MDYRMEAGSLHGVYEVIGLGVDIGTCCCCFLIHVALLTVVVRRPDIPFRGLLRAFSILALLSGTVQGFEVIHFWWPVGPFVTLLKLAALCLLMNVCVRLRTFVLVLSVLKNPLQLEEEIRKFQKIELQLQLEIERRTQLEKDLSSSNRNLNSQLAYREQLEAKLREIEARYSPDREHSPATQSAVDRLEVVHKTLSAMEPDSDHSQTNS